MKLKKIVSLALAGVLAVSMLAGCKNDGSSSSEGEGEVVATGYSTTFSDALDKDVTDLDYVSFKDNANDTAALEKAVNNISEIALENHSKERVVLQLTENNAGADTLKMLSDFVDAADFTDDDVKSGDLGMVWYAANEVNKTTVKDGYIYVVNGAVGTDQALKQIAGMVEDELKGLPEHNTDNGVTDWDYSYVVSVSVASKSLDNAYTGAANSATYIAVTVTRTATNA